jgi:hypothetical protein
VSITAVTELAALAVIVAIGVCIVYAIFELYAGQRAKSVKAIAAVEEIRKLQPQLLSLAQSVRLEGHALRQIATQIEAAVAALEKTITTAVEDSAKQQGRVVQQLLDHFDWREEQLADLVKGISDNIQNLREMQTTPAETKSEATNGNGNGNGNGNFIRLRREPLALDPELRFSALNDWVNSNYLSFLRRASRGWSAPADLISHIPAYFEAHAEITADDFLLIGTRGHPEKVAVRLDDHEFDGGGEPPSNRTELRDENKFAGSRS